MLTPRIVWRFARPLPIYATLIQVTAIYVLAMRCVGKAQFEPVLLAMTALSFVAADVFVLGINQITDIEIDKINKSDLPPVLTFKLSVGIMSLSYVLLIAAGLSHFSGLPRWLFLAAHALLFSLFLRNSKAVDLDDKQVVTRFYRLFWKLLYAECIVFPALCFLG